MLYYIAPQMWAWGKDRVRKLAPVSRLAVILPFEEELFRSAGARAHFVGHPLADLPAPSEPRADFLGRIGVAAERPVLALFPGSRPQEVGRHLGVFVAASAHVRERMPDVQPVLAASSAVPAGAYDDAGLPRTIDGWALLHHARAALVKSGTSTLQAALAGTPLVVTYRVHPVTFRLAQRLVRVPHVGLVNLVAGERIAPELLQDDGTPSRLAAALLPLLDADSSERRTALHGIERVRVALAARDPARTAGDRVADLAAELLGG